MTDHECHNCKGAEFTMRFDEHGRCFSKPCTDCPAGQRIARARSEALDEWKAEKDKKKARWGY